MKCTVKQYCRYLCRLINTVPAIQTSPVAELVEAAGPSIPKKGIVYNHHRRARLTKTRNS